MKDAGEVGYAHNKRSPTPMRTLDEFGVDFNLSSRAQRIARVDETVFERVIAEAQAGGDVASDGSESGCARNWHKCRAERERHSHAFRPRHRQENIGAKGDK